MIRWIRTSRLSIKNSLSLVIMQEAARGGVGEAGQQGGGDQLLYIVKHLMHQLLCKATDDGGRQASGDQSHVLIT